MFNLNAIQLQHKEILGLAQDILNYDSVPKVTTNAFEISLLLGRLAGKLSFHLLSEDKYIYPYLANKEDKTIQETSKRFAVEMGGLAQAFSDYKTEYLSAAKIKNAPAEFIQTSQRIMGAIMERIEKEEKLLYPLLK
jgi:iron-sulfur cluster repair protein YtfE (RIC family)